MSDAPHHHDDDGGDDDGDEAGPLLVSGTTASTARASAATAGLVPAHVPDNFHAFVSVVVKERVKVGAESNAITIEQAYTVEWISPDDWVRLVLGASAPGG